MLVPAFDLSRYQASGGALAARASQLAAFLPTLYASPRTKLSGAMRKLAGAADPLPGGLWLRGAGSGGPLIHPLAMQFPKDAVAAAV